jgi:hypothetical protein
MRGAKAKNENLLEQPTAKSEARSLPTRFEASQHPESKGFIWSAVTFKYLINIRFSFD